MSRRNLILLKSAVWLLCLGPLGRLVYLALTDGLTANPLEFITLSTGTWTFVFILCTLAVTPLRRITGQAWMIKLRRLIGLFAFFYGCLHFLTFLWFDHAFDFNQMIKDVAKRPFITMGFLAFVLMIPLAATSTAWSIRKLGGKRWNLLHRLIYISGIAAAFHFGWKVKADYREPATYATILGVLLLYRLGVWLLPKLRKTAPPEKTAAAP